MCDPGEHRQDDLRHLQPRQPRIRRHHPRLVHLGSHLEKPHTVNQILDCGSEMGPDGKIYSYSCLSCWR